MATAKSKRAWKKFAFDELTNTTSEISETKSDFLLNNCIPRKYFNFENDIIPKFISDLAVHIKKINDIEFWLQNNVVSRLTNKKYSMLLLTGPTGCGKTVTVKVICKKLNIEISEWINPIDKDFDTDYRISQTAQLVEFLSESKYPSLLALDNNKVILIEDYPNSLIRNPSEFASVLEACYDSRSAVIFICTDTTSSSLNLSQTLFPQDVRDKFSIYNINFNECSATLLKKALRRAQNLVQEHLDVCKMPSELVIDSIISSCMGDIRCAMNQFYFACLKGSTDIPLEVNLKNSTKVGNKRKRKETKSGKLQAMVKNEHLTFFHSLGRVLNPKREEINGSWRLQCNVEQLIDELTIQPKTLSDFVHANYMKYFGDIKDICNAAEILSLSQSFYSKWEHEMNISIYGLWLSVLGLMVFNEHRVSKWNQITGPKKLRKILNNNQDMAPLNSIDLCYYNIINKSEHNNKFKIYK